MAITTLRFSELLDEDFQPLRPSHFAALEATRSAFSPGGTGIMMVTDLPQAVESLRLSLLSQSPSLPPRASLLAEHGLGSDTSGPTSPLTATLQLKWEGRPCVREFPVSFPHASQPSLRAGVEALGAVYTALCLGVASACDEWLVGGGSGEGARGGEAVLARALCNAQEAKARLVFYGALSGSCSGGGTSESAAPSPSHTPPWQEWHKDYGLFTAVSAPAYWGTAAAAAGREGAPPSPCNPWLQTAPPKGVGLCVMQPGGEVLPAPIPPGCVGVQVGEAAQILSGGRLVAVPHTVRRLPFASGGCGGEGSVGGLSSSNGGEVCRAAFIVFCQPPSAEPLVPFVGDLGGVGVSVGGGGSPREAAAARVFAAEDPAWASSLRQVIPALSRRWPGSGGIDAPCTFLQFGKNTVKTYFGKGGTQGDKKISAKK